MNKMKQKPYVVAEYYYPKSEHVDDVMKREAREEREHVNPKKTEGLLKVSKDNNVVESNSCFIESD